MAKVYVQRNLNEVIKMERSNTLNQSPKRSVNLQDIEGFLYREVRLLDERRFEEWMDLFTEDGYYWVPARPGQTSPVEEVSLFYDDRELMRTRIQRLRHPRIHAQIPPSRTCHLMGNLQIEDAVPDGADYLVSSVMIMFEYRPGSEMQIFGGRCTHALRLEDKKIKIFWKRVDLVNCDAVFGQLVLPF